MPLDNGKERVKKYSRWPQEKRMLYREGLLRLIVVCYLNMPEIASNLGNVSSFVSELVDVNDGIHNA
jgi:hypothetical protein